MKSDEFRAAVDRLGIAYTPFPGHPALNDAKIGFDLKDQDGPICCAMRARRYQEIMKTYC